jgi:hypothetical protein
MLFRVPFLMLVDNRLGRGRDRHGFDFAKATIASLSPRMTKGIYCEVT